MKKIKYTVFLILVTVGLLFMGELNILNISNFQYRFYNCDFFIDNLGLDISDREMKEDFLKKSKQYDVDFFTLKYIWDETYIYETRIIGTDNAIKWLKDNELKEGENKSLFFDSEYIVFEKYVEANDISSFTEYYFIGDENNLESIKSFKADLVDKYGGGFPKDKASDMNQKLSVIICWGVIFSIMLALTLYEVIYSKKENMLHVIMGDNIITLFFKKSIVDIVVYVFLFVGLYLALENLSHVQYKKDLVIAAFITFLVINTVIQTLTLKVNYKHDLSGAKNGRFLLTTNYIIKEILTVLIILLISLNMYTISEVISILSLKDLFQTYEGYDFYKFGFKMTSENLEKGIFLEDVVYSNFYDKYQRKALLFGDCSGDYGISSFVRVNHNALNEICKRNPELSELYSNINDSDRTVLIPENINTYDYENVKAMKREGYLEEDLYGEVRLLVYPKGVKIPAIKNNSHGYQIRNLRDPVILVDNYTFNKDKDYFDSAHNYSVMYDVGPEEWEIFKAENEIDDALSSVTDINEEYNHISSQQKKKLILIMTISIFVLFLEFSMTFMIIRMEYSFNAIEQALKKVHGYTIMERNIKLIKASTISGVVGFALATLLKITADINVSIALLAAISATLLLTELAAIIIKALSVEKLNISRILKGENV